MDALRAAARRGPPSLTPRRLAAARAALVRSLIAPRSCSATAARMWTVSLLAWGLSAAMNSTLLSISVAMNARLRDKRSSLAMTSLALCLRQAASATVVWHGKSLWCRHSFALQISAAEPETATSSPELRERRCAGRALTTSAIHCTSLTAERRSLTMYLLRMEFAEASDGQHQTIEVGRQRPHYPH